MSIIIAISYVMLFITTPIGLVSIAAKTYGEGKFLPMVFGKLLLAFAVYFAISILIPFFIIALLVGADGKHETVESKLMAQTLCILAVVAYGFAGWLLCSFINGELIKSVSALTTFSEKPQSIFPR